jgi:hypothetical protein
MDRVEQPAESHPDAAAPQAAARSCLAAARRLAVTWSTSRRFRALQELLLDANDVVLHCVDELETLRSGARFSQRPKAKGGRGGLL